MRILSSRYFPVLLWAAMLLGAWLGWRWAFEAPRVEHTRVMRQTSGSRPPITPERTAKLPALDPTPRSIRLWAREGPLGLPADRFLGSGEGAFSRALAFLGRELFSETRLSSEEQRSCATCHDPGWGFGNGRSGASRVPGFANIAYLAPYSQPDGWSRLVDRVDRAWRAEDELACSDPEARLASLLEIPEYADLLALALPEGARLTPSLIPESLAAFLALSRSGGSPYDLQTSVEGAELAPALARGLELFRRHGCEECHPPPLFTDERPHPEEGDPPPRSATLRGDLEARPPYLQDGSCRSLDDLLLVHPRKAAAGRPGNEERRALAAFLRALRGEPPWIETVPPMVTRND